MNANAISQLSGQRHDYVKLRMLPEFEGRLLLTMAEVARLVPLHPDTIGKLCSPGGAWDSYGMVLRTPDLRSVLVSLPLLVEWCLGGQGKERALRDLEAENAALRLQLRELRSRIQLALGQAETAASILRGAAHKEEKA